VLGDVANPGESMSAESMTRAGIDQLAKERDDAVVERVGNVLRQQLRAQACPVIRDFMEKRYRRW
jgi:hypothetical protein